MEVYISIDGVLRNTIQKFDYHYNDAYLASDFENENKFEYGVVEPIKNDDLFNHYRFQSQDEFDFFLFMEYFCNEKEIRVFLEGTNQVEIEKKFLYYTRGILQ
jgi:hypothetical protein